MNSGTGSGSTAAHAVPAQTIPNQRPILFMPCPFMPFSSFSIPKT